MRKLRRPVRCIKRNWLAFTLGVCLTFCLSVAYQALHRTQDPLRLMSSIVTIPWAPQTVVRWDATIDQMARKYSIDPNLVAIIMTLESGGYSNAQSGAGAIGLMQVTPPTASDIARKYLKQPVATYDLYDPKTNIEFGVAYLAYLRSLYGDPQHDPSGYATVELIAAGYNGGPGAAKKLRDGQGLTSTETVSYSRDAANMWRERHASNSPTFDRWLERGGQKLIDKATAQTTVSL